MWKKLLRASLNREPPKPDVSAQLPTDEEFYDGEVTEWSPDDSTESSTSPSN